MSMKIEKNNNFKRIKENIKEFFDVKDPKVFYIALGVIGTIGVTTVLGANAIVNAKKETIPTPTPTPVPVASKMEGNAIQKPEVIYNESVETTAQVPVVNEKSLSELKMEFVYANIENFKKDYFNTCGLEIDDNTATIILSFMNGFSASDFNVNTEDYFIDYTNAIVAYWDKIAVPTAVNFGKTNFRCNSREIVKTIDELGDLSALPEEKITELNEKFTIKPVEGESRVKNGDILPKYIYDELDRKSYMELSDKFVEVINLSYENDTIATVNKIYALEKFIAENWIYTGSFTDGEFDFQNVSEEVQILARIIINMAFDFLPEKSEIKINTLVGEQTVTTSNYDLPFANAAEEDHYEMNSDICSDNMYFYQVLSINSLIKDYPRGDCKTLAK